MADVEVKYKGSTIGQLSATGSLVLNTSGKYCEDNLNVTFSKTAGTAATPATTITANPAIAVSAAGLITATASKTQSVTPTITSGYINSGTAGTITVSGSSTYQLSAQAAATITPTESEQTAVASGKFTTGIVKVGAISSTYVGTGIATRSAANLSASGSVVTAPAGYYASDATKAISAGSATTPATSMTVNPSISINTSTGVITASTSSSKSITPTISAGYISSGTAGTVTVSGSSTYSLTTKGATTYTPTTTNQTISSGTYLTGTQTIKGDANLIAANIAAGVSIFGVNGTHTSGGNIQAAKSTVPAETTVTVSPDSGYDGIAVVTVSAIPSTYVGSGVPTRGASNLSASGSVVTVPSGYYSAQVTKAVSGGTAATPAKTITVNPTFSINSSTGVVTATAAGSSSVTPTITAGYISSGSAGTITVSGSSTYQLSTQAAATITPTTASQTAVAAGKYTTGVVSVAAIPSQYIVPSGSTTYTANGTYDVTSLSSVTVNVAGSSNEGYTATVIAPSQSVTTGSNRQGVLGTVSGTLQDGYHYRVVYDNVEYLTTCHVLWTNNYVIGDYAWATGTQNDYIYPFAIVGYQGNIVVCSMTASSTHTVEIEEIVLNAPYTQCYYGTGYPSSSLGNNGDIYISS